MGCENLLFAERALLSEENRMLFDQNSEKVSRTSVKHTVVGTAKIMSYDDIVVERRMRPEIRMTHTKTLVAVSISKVSLAQPYRIWQWGHSWRFQPALVLS